MQRKTIVVGCVDRATTLPLPGHILSYYHESYSAILQYGEDYENSRIFTTREKNNQLHFEVYPVEIEQDRLVCAEMHGLMLVGSSIGMLNPASYNGRYITNSN